MNNKLLIAFAAGSFAAGAGAAELSLQLHGFSRHFDSAPAGQAWHEANVGAGLRAQFSPEWGVQVGTYRNSLDRNSAYAVAQWTPLAVGAVRVGAFAGAASGYRLPLCAGAMLTAPLSDRLSITLRAVPTFRGSTGFVSAELGVTL